MKNPATQTLGTWPVKSFPESLDELGIPKPEKILARDYKPSGRVPIIDQGQQFIAGWTDDEKVAVRERLPFVVFGDHTRVFKYVDFPFALGADGTHLLKPTSEFNPRFFYFACLHLPLPNRGYNRHFTVLKEQSLPQPPKPEQERIAAVLCKIQRAIEVEKKLVATTRELKQSAMRQLFTHGLRGEAQKETEIGIIPKSWQVLPLSTLITDTDVVDLRGENIRNILYIDVSSVSRDLLRIISYQKFVLKDAPGRARKKIYEGDVIFATVRPTLLRVAIVEKEFNDQVCSTAFCVLRDKNLETRGRFLFYVVQRPQFVNQLAKIETGASYPAVTDRQVRAQLVPVPLENEQNEIANILQTLDRKIAVHERKRVALSDLFQALLHRLMTAQIRVDKLDIDTSEVTALDPSSA